MNKFRLSSSAFERESDDEKIAPKKVFFISVEGNLTEKEYLQGISRYREELGINALVNIEVLQRSKSDTNSAPIQVIELLEEYLELRKLNEDEMIREIPINLISEYGEDIIKTFLEDASKVPKETRNKLNTELTKIGYYMNYRKYLKKYNSELDEFCILIDRDKQTHSETNMRDCISYCEANEYNCFISNPCFEFWLLLHLSDVAKEYDKDLCIIEENPKVSTNHTFVSKQVSEKAHHRKGHIGFKTNYLPNIDNAILRSKSFSLAPNDLINNVGCNIGLLIEKMRDFKENPAE